MKTQGMRATVSTAGLDLAVSRWKITLNRPDLEPQTATTAAEIHAGKHTRSTLAKRERRKKEKREKERKKKEKGERKREEEGNKRKKKK